MNEIDRELNALRERARAADRDAHKAHCEAASATNLASRVIRHIWWSNIVATSLGAIAGAAVVAAYINYGL